MTTSITSYSFVNLRAHENPSESEAVVKLYYKSILTLHAKWGISQLSTSHALIPLTKSQHLISFMHIAPPHPSQYSNLQHLRHTPTSPGVSSSSAFDTVSAPYLSAAAADP